MGTKDEILEQLAKDPKIDLKLLDEPVDLLTQNTVDVEGLKKELDENRQVLRESLLYQQRLKKAYVLEITQLQSQLAEKTKEHEELQAKMMKLSLYVEKIPKLERQLKDVKYKQCNSNIVISNKFVCSDSNKFITRQKGEK